LTPFLYINEKWPREVGRKHQINLMLTSNSQPFAAKIQTRQNILKVTAAASLFVAGGVQVLKTAPTAYDVNNLSRKFISFGLLLSTAVYINPILYNR
jgi:hypothetical protein